MRPCSGEGADLQLGELLGVGLLLGQYGSQPAEEEAERDGDDPGVLQGEPVEVASLNIEVGLPETTGENSTRPTAEIRPP